MMKAATIITIIIMALAAFIAWSILTLVTGLGIREDSLMWNCYLMGNHQCGDVRHILGFILEK